MIPDELRVEVAAGLRRLAERLDALEVLIRAEFDRHAQEVALARRDCLEEREGKD